MRIRNLRGQMVFAAIIVALSLFSARPALAHKCWVQGDDTKLNPAQSAREADALDRAVDAVSPGTSRQVAAQSGLEIVKDLRGIDTLLAKCLRGHFLANVGRLDEADAEGCEKELLLRCETSDGDQPVPFRGKAGYQSARTDKTSIALKFVVKVDEIVIRGPETKNLKTHVFLDDPAAPQREITLYIEGGTYEITYNDNQIVQLDTKTRSTLDLGDKPEPPIAKKSPGDKTPKENVSKPPPTQNPHWFGGLFGRVQRSFELGGGGVFVPGILAAYRSGDVGVDFPIGPILSSSAQGASFRPGLFYSATKWFELGGTAELLAAQFDDTAFEGDVTEVGLVPGLAAGLEVRFRVAMFSLALSGSHYWLFSSELERVSETRFFTAGAGADWRFAL